MSQRELAVNSGIPKSTIARLESGETGDPPVSTLQQLLAGAGYALAVVDDEGHEISHRNGPGPERDRSDRHLPAHLDREPLTGGPRLAGWWGWGRIAWEYTDHPRPTWVYYMRRRAR